METSLKNLIVGLRKCLFIGGKGNLMFKFIEIKEIMKFLV